MPEQGYSSILILLTYLQASSRTVKALKAITFG